MFPEMNEDSHLLWQQALLQAQGQMVIKKIEQQNCLAAKRCTSEGMHQRFSATFESCRLSVEVGEPDDHALSVKVVASSGTQNLRVALLYCCAVDNNF